MTPVWIFPTPCVKKLLLRSAPRRKATENGFKVGTYEELIPQADSVVNLTPDKQHSDVVRSVQPLMKDGAALGYSHGFNIVEVGEQIRKDITVVMVAPKCPGTEVREEYKRGFGVPTLIAVHPENDPKGEGMAIAKAGLRPPAVTVRAYWNLLSWRK